jgi:hypothetical protein
MENELRCEINFKRESTLIYYFKALPMSIKYDFKLLYHIIVLMGAVYR